MFIKIWDTHTHKLSLYECSSVLNQLISFKTDDPVYIKNVWKEIQTKLSLKMRQEVHKRIFHI